MSQPGSDHGTRQVDPKAEAGEDGPGRSEGVSAAALWVSAAMQGQKWGQVNRLLCSQIKYKLRRERRQRGASAADTSSVRQPEALMLTNPMPLGPKDHLNRMHERR